MDEFRAHTVKVVRLHEDTVDVPGPLSNIYQACGRNIGQVISDRRNEGTRIDRAWKDHLKYSGGRGTKIIRGSARRTEGKRSVNVDDDAVGFRVETRGATRGQCRLYPWLPAGPPQRPEAVRPPRAPQRWLMQQEMSSSLKNLLSLCGSCATERIPSSVQRAESTKPKHTGTADWRIAVTEITQR